MSRVIFLSDLHYYGKYDYFCNLVEDIKTHSPDILVLGGDIADGKGYLDEVFSEIRTRLPNTKVLYLPGNHDLWAKNWRIKSNYLVEVVVPQEDFSDLAFKVLIPQLCKQYDIIYLETDSLIVDNWLLCGTLGWYDYSFKYHQFATMPDAYFYKQKYKYNNDGNYIESTLTDVAFSKQLKTRLLKEIKSKKDLVDHIAVFTHVPIFEEATRVFGASQEDWNFGSSYFYNLTLGKELKKIDKLRLVVSGHTHHGIDTVVENNIKFLVSPADYDNARYIIIDLLYTGDILTETI